MSEFETLMEAYKLAGGDPDALTNPRYASLVVHKNKILAATQVEGLKVEATETPTGIRVRLVVQEGRKIENPVHLCFGVLPEEGLQEIFVEVDMAKDSSATLLAHCTFPNALRVKHRMEARFNLGQRSSLGYHEVHYHGTDGGIEVIPRGRIYVAKGAKLDTSFTLIRGMVGKLNIDYEAQIEEKGIAEFVVKVYGKGDDDIRIKEKAVLDGRGARSLIRTRVAVRDRARIKAIGITEGNAPGARGHVDCIEIVQDQARAEAVPIVSVLDDRARVTHEAAIGRVDKKQVETVMARGLSEEEAVDIVVKGMLR